MSCPTCGHTFAWVGAASGGADPCFHCWRCGTLVIDRAGGHRDTYTPGLVARCLAYESSVVVGSLVALGEWHRLGIGESIHPPGGTGGVSDGDR